MFGCIRCFVTLEQLQIQLQSLFDFVGTAFSVGAVAVTIVIGVDIISAAAAFPVKVVAIAVICYCC